MGKYTNNYKRTKTLIDYQKNNEKKKRGSFIFSFLFPSFFIILPLSFLSFQPFLFPSFIFTSTFISSFIFLYLPFSFLTPFLFPRISLSVLLSSIPFSFCIDLVSSLLYLHLTPYITHQINSSLSNYPIIKKKIKRKHLKILL